VTDDEIAKVLAKENEEYKAAGEEHRNLKALLIEFQSKVYLTPEEELEKKRLQKLKLAKKDKMAALIREYKQAHPA
jgi:hypothetical protein